DRRDGVPVEGAGASAGGSGAHPFVDRGEQWAGAGRGRRDRRVGCEDLGRALRPPPEARRAAEAAVAMTASSRFRERKTTCTTDTSASGWWLPYLVSKRKPRHQRHPRTAAPATTSAEMSEGASLPTPAFSSTSVRSYVNRTATVCASDSRTPSL